MLSAWMEHSTLPKFNSLQGDVKTDVLVIGGGLAGLLCSYFLSEAGIDTILVEATTIGSGITKNTTAKITSQHGLIYQNLVHDLGRKKAAMYLTANQTALEKYNHLCKDIDCDFERKDAYVYSLNNSSKIKKEIDALSMLNFKADFIERLPLPFSIAGAIKFSDQAQFNPLKLMAALSQGLRIFEHTRVTGLSGLRALTETGSITAKKIIVATHFPFMNKHGSYFLKMYQHRSYVIALQDAADVSGMYVDEAENGLSFRNYKNLLFVGGGDHRTGEQGGCFQELRDFAKRHYPNAIETYHWATQDCMTLDRIPYIGTYSKNTPDLYVATGFNKWGMTSSMVAAMILTDRITGKHNGYAEVFSPSRSILKPQLAINASKAITNLLSVSQKRCPHLGCALKWNSVEHTWDCPCHGSRFDKKGILIDNPAMRDLKSSPHPGDAQ